MLAILIAPLQALVSRAGLSNHHAPAARTTHSPSLSSAATEKPFGAWASPVSAKFITTSGVRLGGLSLDDKDQLYWLEGRPQEKGRNAVVRFVGEDVPGASERGAVDVTPEEVNVRTRVHEYGGGAYLQGPGGGIIYSDFASQRLYWVKDGAEPADDGAEASLCLTPQSAWPDGQFRFADACVVSSEWIVCVREDHGPSADAKPSEVVNEVVALALDGSGAMRVLASGRDFYAHPRISPDGAHVAYVAWDHPSMPWDFTELRVTPFSEEASGISASTNSHTLIAGGDGDTSVLQPAWHPQSGALYFISDTSGYYNLYRVGASALGSAPRLVLTMDTDLGGNSPGWAFGQQGFAFLHDGRVAAQYTDKATGKTSLLTVTDSDDADEAAASTISYGQSDGLPHMFGSLVPSKSGDTLFFMGGSPTSPGGVYRWRVPPPGAAPSSAAAADSATVAIMLACSSSQRLPDGFVSEPQLIEFPTTLGSAYAYYYPPLSADYVCTTGAPPLLVRAHGGPTGATSAAFNPGIQFWTSRGYAVCDVDYGGSTGYGKEYRRRLRGSWGIVDVDDVCAAATYLVKQGLADPARLAIDGGSAGGFTTLGALAFKDVFTAGCSLYGVADLGVLAGDTHKFESRYLDGLVGPYPQEKAKYDERAPINAVDQLSCPILLLQGDEDKIVPPNQAELMHAAMLKKGLPCALKIYKGEQHGFRQAANIEDALNSELYFFSKVFGIETEPDCDIFEIDNLAV